MKEENTKKSWLINKDTLKEMVWFDQFKAMTTSLDQIEKIVAKYENIS